MASPVAPATVGGALQAGRRALQRRPTGTADGSGVSAGLDRSDGRADPGGPGGSDDTDAATETPALDAEVVLRHILGLTRGALFANLDRAIAPDAYARYAALIARRAAGEPVAYLTGRREFMGLAFAVDGAVLVPRPDTETLVERALARLGATPAGAGATVVDVGTGSGAIAVGVAALAPPGSARLIVATDRSAGAVRVARGNAGRLLAPDRPPVHVVRCSLLTAIRGPIDLLLANLPYIPTPALASLPVSVRRYEPRMALDGGEDGLDLYRDLLADLLGKLAPGATVLLECDPGQVPALRALLATALPGAAVAAVVDLTGRERVVEGRL